MYNINIGDRFTRLEVIDFAGRDKWRKLIVRCKCSCGNVVNISANSLISGATKSCGCLHKDMLRNKNQTHGLSKTDLYFVYKSIIARCYNPNDSAYERYGGRGIYIVPEWYTPGVNGNPGFVAFYNWSISNGYHKGLSIDRTDNDGPYAPWNCRWADYVTQSNNRRNNRHVNFEGKQYTLSQFADYLGINYRLLYMAICNNDNKSINRFIYMKKHPMIKLHRQSGYYRDDEGFIIMIPKYKYEIE